MIKPEERCARTTLFDEVRKENPGHFLKQLCRTKRFFLPGTMQLCLDKTNLGYMLRKQGSEPMDSFATPTNLLHYLLLCYVLMLPSFCNSKLDHNQRLIFNHCENQTSTSPHTDSLSPILSQLFQELQKSSPNSKFFQTNAGNAKMSVTGLFQCRGDLTDDDCNSCVSKLPQMSSTLCGESLLARVQLAGCKIHYQAEGVQTNRLQLLHKTCSFEQGSYGFQAKRDAAFAAVQECTLSSKGYCDQICESVRVRAQCDGNLGDCDCGECVNTAVQIAQEQCGYSVAGEVYLEGCFLSYGYQKNGAFSGFDEDYGLSQHISNKIIAIVIGGVAVVLLGAGLCYMCRKKRKDEY